MLYTSALVLGASFLGKLSTRRHLCSGVDDRGSCFLGKLYAVSWTWGSCAASLTECLCRVNRMLNRETRLAYVTVGRWFNLLLMPLRGEVASARGSCRGINKRLTRRCAVNRCRPSSHVSVEALGEIVRNTRHKCQRAIYNCRRAETSQHKCRVAIYNCRRVLAAMYKCRVAPMQDGHCLSSVGHSLTIGKRVAVPRNSFDGQSLTKGLCRVNELLCRGTPDGQSLRFGKHVARPRYTFAGVCVLGMSRSNTFLRKLLYSGTLASEVVFTAQQRIKPSLVIHQRLSRRIARLCRGLSYETAEVLGELVQRGLHKCQRVILLGKLYLTSSASADVQLSWGSCTPSHAQVPRRV